MPFKPQIKGLDYYEPGTGGGGAVTSVFGRVGGVIATNGDYTPAQVGAEPANANIQTHIALTNLDAHGGTALGALTLYNGADAIKSGNYPVQMTSGVADGATAAGFIFDTTNTLANITARIVSVRNNGVVALSILADGSFAINLAVTGAPSGNRTGYTGLASINAMTQNYAGILSGAIIGAMASPTGNYTVGTMVGVSIGNAFSGPFGGTAGVTTNKVVNVSGSYINAAIGTYYGWYHAPTFTLSTITTYEGMHFAAAPTATNRYGIVLLGDGAGNDLVMGTTKKAKVYATATDLAFYWNGTETLLGSLALTTDGRFTDARTPTVHASTHVTGGTDIIADAVAAGNSGLMTGANLTKLDGIEAGAEVNNISDVNATDLTDGGSTTLHSHAGGGGVISGQATVNFGASSQEDSVAKVTVSNASALTASKIFITPAGIATADHDPDDYQWDNISGYVTNIIDGVSFDLVGVAPNGTFGQYAYNYMIG